MTYSFKNLYTFCSFLLLVELYPLEFYLKPHLRSDEAGKRYQAVTLSTHCTLWATDLFLFSALEAEIILSFGHSWPFFFLLKR